MSAGEQFQTRGRISRRPYGASDRFDTNSGGVPGRAVLGIGKVIPKGRDISIGQRTGNGSKRSMPHTGARTVPENEQVRSTRRLKQDRRHLALIGRREEFKLLFQSLSAWHRG